MPACPTHGLLYWQQGETGGAFICHGFDGEHCGYQITAEQWQAEEGCYRLPPNRA
jgi:hypothetical protein